MIVVKRLAWAVLVMVLGLAAMAAAYVYQTFPSLDGTIQITGLQSPLRIARDDADVTHLTAASERDVWFGIGYVHAQERSWQLEFNRRVMRGELSEVLGPATLDTDKLLRTLGIVQAAQIQWEGMPKEGRDALTAYADGINAFHAQSKQALPPEFHILGVKPGKWTPQDSVGWALMMALDLGDNWGTELARLRALQHVPTARMWQLFAPNGGEAPRSKVDFAKLYADLDVYLPPAVTAINSGAVRARSISSTGLFDAQTLANQVAQWSGDFASHPGNVEGKGSNNWVLAGSHTTSGKPLLANDPHLGLSAPAIWYFASLQAPGLNTIGATLPGLPFVVLGRTDKVAWGITNTGPDVQDLYLEQINPENPNQYRLPDAHHEYAWADFSTRSERIKVKGQGDVLITVRSTRHGPVISDVQKSAAEVINLHQYALALRWSALDADNHSIMASLQGNRAQSVAELKAAYTHFHSPMSNLVMADVDGHIAFKAVGRVPLRRADNDIMGMAPSPGWEPRYDWIGWIAAADTPEDDGRKGWIATANQNVAPPGYKHFMGQDFALPLRFERITALLAATPQHDMASMERMQADVVSAATARLLPVLRKAVPTHALGPKAMALLKDFDSNMRPNAPAPLIFAAWVDAVARNLITPKLGDASFRALYGKRHFRVAVEQALLGADTWWCAPQSCQEQVNAALDQALERLQAAYGADPAQWQWGTAHFAQSAHRPFSNVAPLSRWFDVQTPTGGDPFTLNVGQYWPNDAKMPFANRHAASMRAVYDLSDLERSEFIYQTGQSGLVFSSRYRDMAQPWGAVQYRPLQLSPPHMAHTLILNP